MEKQEETKEEEKNQLVEVPTGSMVAVQLKDKRILAIEQAVLELLNRVDKLEKLVG
jgi:hypothetical protein